MFNFNNQVIVKIEHLKKGPFWPCEQVLVAGKGLLYLLMANSSQFSGLHEDLGCMILQNGGIGTFTDIFNF